MGDLERDIIELGERSAVEDYFDDLRSITARANEAHYLAWCLEYNRPQQRFGVAR